MKDSKEKEHRISNLKDMIDNVKEEEEINEYDELEEDDELIEYLNKDNVDFEGLEIDDEFIYHPGDDNSNAIDLEENPVNEDYIIKAPKTEDIENSDEMNEFEEFDDELAGEISESFDNVINAKVRGRPILAIVSSVLGVILLILSVYIFQSRSERIIDNVVAGETNFMFVIFVIVGLFLLIFGIYKLFDLKNPFENITSSIDSIDDDKKEKKEDTAVEEPKPSPKAIPKSNIPLDKESYKIGEFDMNELKSSLKKPAVSKKAEKEEPAEEKVEDLPRAKGKKPAKKEITDEEMEYEKAKLESESIDDIFAEVEDIEDIPIISIDSEEKK